jgi:hypothetical protein
MKLRNDENAQGKRRHRFQADKKSPPHDGNTDLSQIMIKAVKYGDIAQGGRYYKQQ